MSQPPPGYLRNSQFVPRATRGEKDPAVQMKMKAQPAYCCRQWNYLMVPLLSVALKAVCGILTMTCDTPHRTVYDIRHRFITLNLKITTTCRISYVEYIFKTLVVSYTSWVVTPKFAPKVGAVPRRTGIQPRKRNCDAATSRKRRTGGREYGPS